MSETLRFRQRKSVTRTFRLEDDIDLKIEEVAAREKVSVNYLVNRILRRFIDWEYLADKFGITWETPSTLKRLLSYLTDDEVREFANWSCENAFRDFIVFWFKNVNLDNTIKTIRLHSLSGNFQIEERMEDGIKYIICKHNRGGSWSLYYEVLFKHMLVDHLKAKAEVNSTEDQVTIQIGLPRSDFLSKIEEENIHSRGTGSSRVFPLSH